MAYAIVLNDTATEWDGLSWRDSQGRSHPANAPALYSEGERIAADCYEITETEIPDGQISIGFTLEWDEEEGTVTRVHTLDDAPEVVPTSSPPSLKACALRVPVIDDEVQVVGGPFKVAAIMFVDTGTFIVIFSESLGPDEPFVIPNNGISIAISEWGEEYATIEIRDHAGGSLITPASFGFSLYNF